MARGFYTISNGGSVVACAKDSKLFLSRSNGEKKCVLLYFLNCMACCQSNHEFNARAGTGAG